MVSISPADADGGASGHQIRMSAGSTVNVTVNVTAEDTSIRKTYTVKVYRERSTLSLCEYAFRAEPERGNAVPLVSARP